MKLKIALLGRYGVYSPSDQMSLVRFRAKPFHTI